MHKRLKVVACAALAAFMLQGTGCQSARELGDLVIVMGIGMDSDRKSPGNIMLTAQIVLPEKISSSQGGGGSSPDSQGPFHNLDSSEKNTFEAVRGYTHMVAGKLYIAHAQVFVIGREMAEGGIAKHLDFFTRAKETRPTTKIVISETTASEVLGVKPQDEMLPAIHIAHLVEGQTVNSKSKQTMLLDYEKAMQSKSSSLIVPMLRIEVKEGKQMLSISGMAVFKEDKMVGELSESETRGVLWVIEEIQSTVINVEIAGGVASFDVLSAKSRVSPTISDGRVTIKIEVSASVKLAEQTCKENLATPERIAELQALAGEAIRSEILLAYEKAASLKADVFGFGEMIHRHDKASWRKMEADWDRLFPGIMLDVGAEVTVKSVGSLERPVWDMQNEE